MRLAIVVLITLLTTQVLAQRGKDGSKTVAGSEIVNEYTTLTADAAAGVTSLFVASNNLNANGRFGGALASGDLILVIQMQGASINGILHPTFGDVCSPNDITWGEISSLNNCGNYEFVEVTGTTGGSIINLRCGLENSYTSAGNVQIVRVQRYSDLTVSGTLTAEAWNGATGGICAVEVEGNTVINGSVDVSALGFRGGAAAGNDAPTSDYNANWHAGTAQDKGGEKGEGIVGDWADYDLVGGRYAKGAIGNGGGGGSAHNSAGGGGANASNGTYTWSGVGVPDFTTGTWGTSWGLEGLSAGMESSGGGRGGYAWSGTALDVTMVAPGDPAWAGHNRNNIGGYGGRDLDYSTGKVFMGGGGGGGHENDQDGGRGGNGGGMIFIEAHGTVSGSGVINADGENGEGSEGDSPGFGQVENKDGSGGAGSGGTVVIKNSASITGVNITASGGDGGNQVLEFGVSASSEEAQGPGGGGGGGYIITSGTSGGTSVVGGRFGTTNASAMALFDANGATSGDDGLIETSVYTDGTLTVPNDTICAGNTGTLNSSGTPEAGSTITWYDATWTQVGTGASYTTGTLSADAMYFYGSCPGTDFDTVWVIVGTGVVLDDASVSVVDESCAGNDGSITGITISGGTLPYSYSWNGGPSSGLDTTNAGAGSYSLVVTDALGCTDNSGPHTIGTSGGPSINAGAISITDESCAGNDGAITGITVSGGTLPYTYAWNGGPSSSADTTGAGAGSYTLVVTDGLGCTDSSGPHTIGSSAGLLIDASGISITDAGCAAANGAIAGITVSGGTMPYDFDWNGSISSSEDTTGLAAGTYTLNVTDDNGCTISSGPHTVNSVNTLVIDSTAFDLADENCTSADGHVVGIVVSGGTMPYTYSWNGVTTSGADTVGLAAGNYTLVVTDASGCVDSTGVYTVNSVSDLVIDSTASIVTDANCLANDGSIAGITYTSSGSAYSFTWNGAPSGSADINALAPGTYTLVVTDDNGCVDSTGVYTINSVNNMVIDSTGFIATDANCTSIDGSITGITVSGGAMPYNYAWNGSTSSSADTSNIGPGSYTLVISDANGCVDSTGVYTINSVNNMVLDTTAFVVTDANCGAADGGVSGITVSGPGSTYTYEWNGVATGGIDLSGVPSGSYSLVVTDNNGCVDSTGVYNVGSISTLAIDTSALNIVNELCNSGNGTITGIVVSGGTMPYSYDWNGNIASGTDTSGVGAGAYTLTVTDGAGCIEIMGPINVGTNNTLNVDSSAVVVNDDHCGLNSGSITGLSASGAGAVTYVWNGVETATADTIGLGTGTYTVVISDAAGCIDSLTYLVGSIAGPSIDTTAMVVVPESCAGLDGSISGISASGGSGSLIADWDSGISNFDTFGIASGSYTLTVTDTAGCVDSVTINVGTVGFPTADFTFGPQPADEDNPLIDFTDASSTDVVQWDWSFDTLGTSTLTDPSFNFPGSGTFPVTLVVTSAGGCSDSITYDVVIDPVDSIIIPNVMTPDGDGQNDIFVVQGLPTGSSIEIYNRWGQLLYGTKDYLNNWDGRTLAGELVSSGTYYYVITTPDEEKFAGHVTVFSE